MIEEAQDPQGPSRSARLLQALQERGLPRHAGMQLAREYELHHPDEGVYGDVMGTAAASGVATVNAGLRLGRAAQWLVNQPAKLFGADSWTPISTQLKDYLPDDAAMKLESRMSQAPRLARGIASAAGEIPPLLAGGAGSGVIGKVVGAPGTAIGAMGKLASPVVAAGAKVLEKAPKLAALLEKGSLIPRAIEMGTGFGLYGMMTTEGGASERSAAFFHDAAVGAGAAVLSAAANAVEKAILSHGMGIGSKRAAKVLRDDIFGGTAKPDLVLRADALLVSSAIEATGFAGLSKDWWKNVIAGAQGDKEAMSNALETWAGTYAAVLIARTGRTDILKSFRREAPDLNTLEPRLLAEGVRTGQEPGAPSAGNPPKDMALLPGPKPAAHGPIQEPAVEAAGRLPALDRATRPLFHSGWDLKPGVEVKDGRNVITMQFPGAGEVRMWENEGQAGPATEAFGLEVPPAVFRMVRGNVDIPDGTENIRMVGKVAEEFTRDLAALSMLRRIRGEVLFGEGGEAWAGGPWRGQDGRYHSIGLDGKHYSSTVFPEDGFKPEPDQPMSSFDNGNAQNPQIGRWIDLVRQLRAHTAPNPGLDLLETSLALAVKGHPNSASTQEIVKLLATEWQPGVLNADLVAGMLRPDTIEQFGLTIGQVAAGHLTADQAMAQIGTALAGPSRGTELQAPPDDAAQPPTAAEPEPTQPTNPEEVAGGRDWSSATPEERREGARAYVSVSPSATARTLQETFLIPRETARDILKRGGEAGFVTVDLTAPVASIGEMAQAVGSLAAKGHEYAFKPMMEELASRGGKAGQELSAKFREINTRQRKLLGVSGGHAAEALRSARNLDLKGKTETATTPEGKTYRRLRRTNLIEGTAQNATPEEQVYGEAMNRALLTMQHTAAAAGGRVSVRRGDTHASIPMDKAGRAKEPYQYDEAYFKMLESPSDRQFFYRTLADLNPGLDAAALEKGFLDRQSAQDKDSPEAKAAVEIQRTVKYMPASLDFPRPGGKTETIAILESDPAIAAHRILERQSGRVATMQVIGQDLWVGKEFPQEVRERMYADAGIDKPGITTTLRKFSNAIQNDETVKDKAEVLRLAQDIAERLQGRNPHPPSSLSRLAGEVQSVPRAFLAWKGGFYDPIASIVEPVVDVGVINMFRALWDIVADRRSTPLPSLKGMSPKEAAGAMFRWLTDGSREAEAFGSLAHELSSLEVDTAETLNRKLASVILKPSNFFERMKTGVLHRAAKVWVQQMRKDPKADDRDILVDILKMSEATADLALSGQAPGILYEQIRREMVAHWASRGRTVESSQLGANQTAKNWVAFLGYATKRIDNVEKTFGSVAKRLTARNSTVAQRAHAMRRLIYRLTGYGIGGTMSLAAMLVLAGLFQGEDGLDRLRRNIANYPLKTIGKAALGQAISGPYGMVVNAAIEGDAAQLAQPIGGVNVIKGIIDAVAYGGGNPFDIVSRAAASIGLIPREARDLAILGISHWIGSEELLSLSRVVNEWKRLEGVKDAYGEREKQPEFYAAMKVLHEKITAGETNVQPEIDKALALQPGQSAAQRLRSMRWLDNLSDKERVSLFAYAGKDRFDQIVAHDEALTALARDIGKKTGTYAEDWGKELEDATTVAASGAPSAWSRVIDRAVAERAEELFSQTPPKSDLQELAMTMADHPESLAKEGGLSESFREELAFRKPNRPRTSRGILEHLEDRARSKADRRAKEAFEEEMQRRRAKR